MFSHAIYKSSLFAVLLLSLLFISQRHSRSNHTDQFSRSHITNTTILAFHTTLSTGSVSYYTKRTLETYLWYYQLETTLVSLLLSIALSYSMSMQSTVYSSLKHTTSYHTANDTTDTINITTQGSLHRRSLLLTTTLSSLLSIHLFITIQEDLLSHQDTRHLTSRHSYHSTSLPSSIP